MTAIDLNSAPRAASLFSRFWTILRRNVAPVEQNETLARARTADSAGKTPEFHGQWRMLKHI